jgi:hypothetical protein
MPSGWGCVDVKANIAEVLARSGTDNGTREDMPTLGPTINMSDNLAVNPNPDVYGGSAESGEPVRDPTIRDPAPCVGTGEC